MPPSLALLCPPSLEISAVSSSIPGSLPVISSLPPPPCHFGVALLTYTDAGAFCSLGSWWSAVFPPLLRPAPPWGGSSPYGPCRGSVRVVSSRSFSPFSATSFPSSSGRPFRASSAACGRSRRSSVLPLAPSSCPPSVGAGSSPSTFRLAWRRLRSCGDTRKGGPRNPGPAALTCAAPRWRRPYACRPRGRKPVSNTELAALGCCACRSGHIRSSGVGECQSHGPSRLAPQSRYRSSDCRRGPYGHCHVRSYHLYTALGAGGPGRLTFQRRRFGRRDVDRLAGRLGSRRLLHGSHRISASRGRWDPCLACRHLDACHRVSRPRVRVDRSGIARDRRRNGCHRGALAHRDSEHRRLEPSRCRHRPQPVLTHDRWRGRRLADGRASAAIHQLGQGSTQLPRAAPGGAAR